MTKGVEIDVAMNVRKFQAGAKDVEAGFEQVSDSLDDIAKEGDAAGDKLAAGLKAGGKDAETAVDRLTDRFKDVARESDDAADAVRADLGKVERSYKDLADTAKRESRASGDALRGDFQRGADGASDGLDDLKDESKSTAKEAAASFDGSAQSIVDAFQEVAANAFIGFGPAGLVAGLAAAAGIGLISAALVDGTEQGEALKQKVSEVTAELIESGKTGEVSLEFLVSKIQELATATEGVTLKDLAKTAKESGSDFRDLAQAYAGNTRGLKDLWREGDKRLKQLEEEADATDVTTSAGTRRYSSLMKQIAAQQSYRDYLGQSIGVAKEAAEAERNYAEAGGPELEAKAAALDEYASGVQDALTEAGEAWETYTHDGVVNLDEYNAAIEAQAAAISAYQANVVTATQTLSQEALNYIMSLGPEAAPLLQAYVDAPLEQKQRTAANWATLGTAAADSYTANLKAGIPAEVQGPVVKVTADTSDLEWRLEQFTQKNYTVGVGVLLRPGSAVDQ